MSLNLGLIFSIIVTLSIVFASVYLIVKYMETMQRINRGKPAVIVEKHYNNLNNYQKNKNREIIIDVECEIINNNKKKLLIGDSKHVT